MYFLIGLGTSATLCAADGGGLALVQPLSWARRHHRRAGNYVAGTVWPPLINLGLQRFGWRGTHVAIGLFCAVAMSLLLLVLRARMGGAGAA